MKGYATNAYGVMGKTSVIVFGVVLPALVIFVCPPAAYVCVPLALFWPRQRRVLDAAGRLDRTALALCLVGVLLPLSYIGFGLTQVFLAHNSGNMFYLFMCPLVLAALHQRRARLGCPRPL